MTQNRASKSRVYRGFSKKIDKIKTFSKNQLIRPQIDTNISIEIERLKLASMEVYFKKIRKNTDISETSTDTTAN